MKIWNDDNRKEKLSKLIYTLKKISNYQLSSIYDQDEKFNKYKRKDVPQETQELLLLKAQEKRLRKQVKKEEI